MNALPMYQQVEGRTPARFARILAVAFAALFVLFGGFATVSYCAYGSAVSSNVLNSLHEDVWGSAARVALAVVVAGVFPLQAMSMKAPVLALYPAKDSPQLALATLFIVGGSCLASLWLSDLGLVNVVAGASQLFFFIGAVPALAGVFLMTDDGGLKDALWWRCAMGFLVVFTSGGTVLCFMYGESNFTEELMSSCRVLGSVGGGAGIGSVS
jgi:hypothetical protein